jgi:hypothetical protein
VFAALYACLLYSKYRPPKYWPSKYWPPKYRRPVPAALYRAARGSYTLNRYPMPDSVSRYLGRDGSGSSLRRSWARYTRR